MRRDMETSQGVMSLCSQRANFKA